MSKSKVLFMVSGSIAAFKACQVVSSLVQNGFEVKVALTNSAKRFVGPVTWEGLTGHKVFDDIWEAGRAMDHIELTRWADVAVVCPASANTLGEMAMGLTNSPIGALALAWPKGKPFLVFPAMNSLMLDSVVVQENLERLKTQGKRIYPTESGHLACGETGEGRLMNPEQIVNQIQLALQKRGKVLITGGATREPLDGVRFISNVSTGQTAARLADQMSALGYEVDALLGIGSASPQLPCAIENFTSVRDLEAKIKTRLENTSYLAIVHAAAVSDFQMKDPAVAVKWKSSESLDLELVATPKLLPNFKNQSRNPKIKVIGFKMTLNQSEGELVEQARKILDRGIDLVVGNDWARVNADRSRHPGVLLSPDRKLRFETITELARLLDNTITNETNEEVQYDAMS